MSSPLLLQLCLLEPEQFSLKFLSFRNTSLKELAPMLVSDLLLHSFSFKTHCIYFAIDRVGVRNSFVRILAGLNFKVIRSQFRADFSRFHAMASWSGLSSVTPVGSVRLSMKVSVDVTIGGSSASPYLCEFDSLGVELFNLCLDCLLCHLSELGLASTNWDGDS